jgi:uncharacterized protein (TIGR02145 family)
MKTLTGKLFAAFGMFFLSTLNVNGQNNVLDFDGIDDRIEISGDYVLSTNNITLECWVMLKSTPTDTSYIITNRGQYSGITGNWFGLGITSNKKALFEIAGSGDYNSLLGMTILKLNTWYHIAAVREASNLYLYINNALDNSMPAMSLMNVSSSYNASIGFRKNTTNKNFINGQLDDLRVWSRAKTQAQITDSMNVSIISAVQGLVSMYKFDQGAAGGNNSGLTTLTDFMGTKNGSLYGFGLIGLSSNWVSSNAFEIRVDNIRFNDATIHWKKGTNADRAVFVKQTNIGSPAPSNNTSYNSSETFGGGAQIGGTGWYRVYNYCDTAANISGLAANTTYRVQVCEFNGMPGAEQYNTAAAFNNPFNFKTAKSFMLDSIRQDSAKCKGYPDGKLKIYISGGAPPYSYSWRVSGFGWNNSMSSDTIIIIPGLQANFYEVSLSDFVFGSTYQVNGVYQNVYEPMFQPKIVIDPSTFQTCVNQNTNLGVTVQNAASPVNYNWSGSGVSHLNQLTTCCPTFNSNTSGDYFLRLDVTDNKGCNAWKDTMVKVMLKPSVNAGVDRTIEATSIQLSAYSINGQSGMWSVLSGTGGTIYQTANPNSMFSGMPDNTYALRWEDSNICGSSADTVLIQFKHSTKTDSLQLYMPFSNNLDVSDQSKYHRNGTLYGAMNMNYDKSGNSALQFNASMANQYVTVPSVMGIMTDSFSISVWVKPVFSTGNELSIVTVENGYYMYISNIDHKVYASTYYSGSYQSPIVSNIPVLEKQWSLITWTRDVGGNSKITINNNNASAQTLSHGIPASSLSTLYFGTTSTYSKFFDGSMDELRLYNRVLKKSEIDTLFLKPSFVVLNKTNSNIAGIPNAKDTIIINSNTSWNVFDIPFWINASKTSGFGNDTIFLKAQGNFGEFNRNSTIHIKSFDNMNYLMYMINQQPAITTGLVAYWPFNSSTFDNSGHNYNATEFGNTFSYINDRNNNSSSAIQFNGTNNYLTVPTAVYFNSDFTITTWVNITSHNQWQNLLDFGTGTTNNVVFGLSYDFSGNPNFKVRNGVSESTLNPSLVLPTNSWKLLTLTLSNNKFKYYIDGVVADSTNGLVNNPSERTASVETPVNVVRTSNYIGMSNFGSYYFNGALDDLRIYNRALSPIEIREMYCPSVQKPNLGKDSLNLSDIYYYFNLGALPANNTRTWSYASGSPNTDGIMPSCNGCSFQGVPGHTYIIVCTESNTCGNSNKDTVVIGFAYNLQYGIVAHYPFDGNANDISGNNYNGTMQNSPSFVVNRSGESSKAIHFASTSSQYITGMTNPLPLSPDEFSIVLWFKPDASIANSAIIRYGQVGEYGISYTNDSINFGVHMTQETGPWHNIKYKTVNKNWIHIVATYKKANIIRLYINGIKQDSLYFSETSLSQQTNVYSAFGAFNRDWAPWTDNFVDGALDDVIVYNRVLSPQEIKMLATDPVSSISVTPSSVSIQEKWPFKVKINVEPFNAFDTSFYTGSTNPNIVMTDSLGYLYAINSGNAIANYTTKVGGKSATVNVNVFDSIPGPYVYDIDGHKYHTKQIGTQTWLRENLFVSRFNNGDTISVGHFALDNFYENASLFGYLYNWNVITDSRKVCPNGYHVPDSAEWKTLIDYLGGFAVAGQKLKAQGKYSLGTGYWEDYPGLNNSLFTAFPAGYRLNSDGKFYSAPGLTKIWTNKQNFSNSSLAYSMSMSDAGNNIAMQNMDKQDALSVRCIKDICMPPVANAGADQSGITATQANLAANFPGGVGRYWFNLDSAVNGGSFNNRVIENTQFTGQPGKTYHLVWMLSNVCGTSKDTVLISFAPCAFSTSISGSSSVCQGGTIILTATSGNSWTWSGPDASNSNANNLTLTNVALSKSGTYTVIAQDNRGCSDTKNITVTVQPNPSTPIFTVTQPTCTIPSGKIKIISPKAAGMTYSVNGSTYQADSLFSGLSAAMYNVTAKSSSGCISTNANISINAALALPSVPTFANISQPNCAVTTGTIAFNPQTGVEYSLGSGYQTNPVFSSLASGSYNPSVRRIADVSCITSGSAQTINPIPSPPAAPTATASQSFCGSATIAGLQATPASGATLQWFNAATGGTAIIETTSVNSGTYYAGSYEVATLCASTNRTAVVAIINPIPPVPIATVVHPTCSITTGSMTITSPVGTKMGYSINNTDYSNTSGIFTSLPSGIYPVTAKSEFGCISGPANITINPVLSVPAVPVLYTIQPLCSNGTGSIEVKSPLGAGLSYSMDGSNFLNTPLFSGLLAGKYSLTVKNSDGCISMNTSTLTNPAQLSLTLTVTDIGRGIKGQVVATAGGGTGSYNYSIDGIKFQTSNTFFIPKAGRYNITLKDANGCRMMTSDTVKDNTPACNASFSFAVDVSNPLKVSFTDKSDWATDYYWSFGDDETDLTANPIHTYATSDKYEACLTIMDMMTGCMSSTCQTVQVVAAQEMIVSAGFTFVQNNKTVTFTDKSENGNNIYWFFGDGKFSNEISPVHTYNKVGSYNVCQKIYNTTNGKSDQVCQTIVIGAPPCIISSGFNFMSTGGNTVNFSSTSKGNITSYYWNFDDGNVTSQSNPQHTFKKAGYYFVTLSVRDTIGGCGDSYAEMIKVGKIECKANFDFSIDPSTYSASFTNNSTGDLKEYFWLFDGKDFDLNKDPASYKFGKAGLHKASLTVTDVTGSCTDYIEKDIQFGNIDCDAQFSYYIDSMKLTGYFYNKDVAGGTNTFWLFGDGAVSSENNPTHKYKGPGYYNVSLTTFNPDPAAKCMDNKIEKILVGNSKRDCQAEYIYLIDPTATQMVYFKDNSSGAIKSWLWNFGDGSLSNDKNPSHTYGKSKYYNVCLTVIDSFGNTNISCKDMKVGTEETRNAKAGFMYNIESNSLKVTFINNSSGNYQNTTWDFGDGTTSTDASPEHTFAQAGYYLVMLEVKNTTSGYTDYKLELMNVSMPNVFKVMFGYVSRPYDKKAGGYPVDFIGAGLGDQARLKWSFGDNSTEDSTTNTPTHTFTDTGKYQVCLTYADPVTGDVDEHCEWVTTDKLCKSDTMRPTPSCKPITVSLTDGSVTINAKDIDNGSKDDCGAVTLDINPKTFTIPDNYNVTLTVKDKNGNVATCKNTVTVQSATGIGKVVDTKVTSMEMYPNPFKNQLTVNYSLVKDASIELTLTDLAGKQIAVIRKGQVTAGIHIDNYDTNMLDAGTYILQLKTSNGERLKKVVIKN